MLKVLDGVPTLCVAKQDKNKTGHAVSVFLAPAQLVKAAKKMFDGGYVLEDILALDFNDGMMVIYHYNSLMVDDRIVMRVMVDRNKPVVPSITSVFDGAEWHERECRDFHGVTFEGNPNLVPLLMPAEDVDLHPLLKADKSRKDIKDILQLGEVVSCSPEIEMLFAKEAEAASAE